MIYTETKIININEDLYIEVDFAMDTEKGFLYGEVRDNSDEVLYFSSNLEEIKAFIEGFKAAF